MKKASFISILALLSISGCTLDDAIELGFDCPPRMFAYDVDSGQAPYLCMLDDNDINDAGIPNCVPCDFKMNRIADDERIVLAKNNNGNYIYSNADADEENVNRKYLSEKAKGYIVYKYSTYVSYLENLEPDDNNQKIASLYAISGFCTRTDLERYDECNVLCSDESESCDASCKKVISNASKCFMIKGYSTFFDHNICPAEYPICSFGQYDAKGNNFYCSFNNVGECDPETVNIDCANRITHWQNGECQNNICVVTECSEGYQAANDGKSCVADCKSGQHYDSSVQKCVVDDIDNCGLTGKTCASIIPQWVAGTCEAGVCKVSECSAGFKPAQEQLSCVSNCDVGMHYDEDVQNCVDDDIENCGSKGKSCASMISQWVDGACEDGVCKVSECSTGFKPAFDQLSCASDCQTGQHYDNNDQRCVDDDLNNCGATGKSCAASVTQWVAGICEAGVCKVSECAEGFMPAFDQLSCASDCQSGQHYDNSAQKCVDDDVDNCGAADKHCSDIVPQWVGGSCEAGVCKVSECVDGFIPTGDGLSCVSDCPGGTRCKSNDQIVCIDPMTNNSFCGADSDCQNYSTCVEGEMCINGTCTLKYCTDGVSVICTTSQPPACINIKASDAQNCGSCGYDCSKHPQNHASSNTCSSGDCLYECESGYTNCGEAKVPNCILNANFQTDSNNCGGCGTQCSTQDEYCKNGKCVKSSCKDSCQYNDECVNTNDHCGTSCTNCGSLPYVASSQCVSGSCKIDTCTSNAHLYNNTCELDSLSNCGSHDYTCSEKIANWSSGTCESHQCKVSACKGNYHVYNNTCEADSVTNCGSHGYNCADHITNWSNGSCSDHQCTVSSCSGSNHVYGNTCEADSVTNCGSHGYKCADYISNWSSGTCTNHQCALTACSGNNHVYNNTCEADSITNCGSHGYKCADHVTNWSSGSCTNHTCTVSTCSGSNHVYNNTCEADSVTNCGSHGYKCADHITNWSNGTCTNHQCSVTACSGSNHVYNNACEADSVTNCGSHGYKCADHVTNWSNGTCTDHTCTVTACSGNNHVYNNTCEADSVTNCGSHGYSCADHVTNWSNGTCTNKVCTVTACSGSNHVYNNACEADSVTNCGSHGYSCADHVTNWSNGTCTNHTCTVTACSGSNHVYNNACEADSITNCGSHGYRCTDHVTNWSSGTCTNHICTVSTCYGSNHVYNNACEADSVTNCGSHGYVCADHITNWASGTCSSHTCTVSTCSGSNHVYNNACEADSITNCGSHGYKCADHVTGWGGGTCTNHQCKPTSCSGTYHLYNDTCEADTETNCGAHGVSCETGETCQSKTCKCPGGYMNATYSDKTVRAACITTKDDFLNFRNAINAGNVWPSDNTDKYYVLTRNIALGTQSSWTGAGTKEHPFAGTFIGNNKTISGTLTCTSDYCGIFGYFGNYTTNTGLWNLRSSVTVTGNYDYVGGIVGYSNYAGLYNLTSSGSVSGKKNVGGIAGYSAPGGITNSTSSASVTASDSYAGGITGLEGGGNITNCSATGNVSASKGTAGGIVGMLSGASVSNSYATGSVTGSTSGDFGGIAGFVSGGAISNSYSTSYISANGTCGGLVGKNGSCTISSSYHTGNISCSGSAGGLIGKIQSGSMIKQSGAFGRCSGPIVGGLVGSIEASPVSIENSFAVVELDGGNMGGLVGYSSISNDANSKLNCNWVGSIFSNTSTNRGAVSYGTNTFTQNGPIFVYKPTHTAASNVNYSSSTFTLSANTPMLGSAQMLNALTSSCSGGSWVSRSCTVNNGLAGSGTYTLPMPGITPSNCH